MTDIRLTRLLKRYQQEVTSGDMTHLKDLIAAMVISDLTAINDSYLIQKGVNNITLGSLLKNKKDNKYKVPSKYEIYDNKKRYERNTKLGLQSIINCEEKAANTWIDMMLNINMIKEFETINPNEYVLGKFIHDYKLKQLLPISYKPLHKVLNTKDKNELGVTPISPATKKVLELRRKSGR
jgi:hypothetical protein